MDNPDSKFKLADSCIPPLYEGDYTIRLTQEVTKPDKDEFSVEKKFCVAANTEFLSEDMIFSIYPAKNQQGDFSTDLPFMVFNDPSYPWMKYAGKDSSDLDVPWIALIVVKEGEAEEEKDVKYSELENEAGANVFFPYKKTKNTACKNDDLVHIIKFKKDQLSSLLPDKEDRAWLAHYKQVSLSNAEDCLTHQDNNFSAVIANRFPPYIEGSITKSTVHLIAACDYDDLDSTDAEFVNVISLYHWDIYSEKNTDKSFVTIVEGLQGNSRSVMDGMLKPHYLRTGEKTYSWYHSPLLPEKYIRADNINGEETFTSDGRLIYNKENGIFDVTYSAAFNLGRLVTLSHFTEAQEIVSWRKQQRIKDHLDDLEKNTAIDDYELKTVVIRLGEGKLR